MTASKVPLVSSIEGFQCILKYCEMKWMTINLEESLNVLSGKMSPLIEVLQVLH